MAESGRADVQLDRRRAAERIDTDTAAELVKMQEINQ